MIEIYQGTIDDIIGFAGIYEKYLREVYSDSILNETDINKIIEQVEKTKRLQSGLVNPLCKVLFAKINNEIGGFLEAFIVKNDYMFEKPHVYISNLYFDKEIFKGEKTFECLYEMFNKIKFWAVENEIYFICNDVDETNKNMKLLNKIMKFNAYRTRYFIEV